VPETIWDKLRRWTPWAVAGRARLLVRRWWRRRACRRLGGCVPETDSYGDAAVCVRCRYTMGHYVAWVYPDGGRGSGIHLGSRYVRLDAGFVVRVPDDIPMIPLEMSPR
jgi:hypothetical protein